MLFSCNKNFTALLDSNKLPRKYGYATDFYFKQSGKTTMRTPADSVNPPTTVRPPADSMNTTEKVQPFAIKLLNFHHRDIQTCYANSVIQSLLALDAFKHEVSFCPCQIL